MKNQDIKELKGMKITIWDKIADILFYNNFVYFIKHTIRFIKRLPKWVKVAWNQEDWDYEYLYDLIELKLIELKKAQEKDTLHVGNNKRVRQINICLQRLDRFRNWPSYYDYPIDDIIHLPVHDSKYGTGYRMEYTNEENEKQRQGANYFEQHNYDKFWKDFLDYHQGWWT